MKLNFTFTPLNEVVEVDGTVDEISALLRSLANVKVPKSVVVPSKTTTSPASVQIIEPRQITKKYIKHRALKQTDDFIAAIYLYEPNPATDSGRGAYIAAQIMKGETLNIDKLARKAQGRRQTVLNTVRRMRDNGAVIDVTKTAVKLVSVPEPPYQAKGYTHPSPTTKTISAVAKSTSPNDTAAKLLSSLKNINLA